MEEKQRGLRFGSVEFSGYGAFPERFATELISRGVEEGTDSSFRF